MKVLKLILLMLLLSALLISGVSCQTTDGSDEGSEAENTTEVPENTKKEYVRGNPECTPTISNSLLVKRGMTYEEVYIIMGDSKYGVGEDNVYVWDLVEGDNFIVWFELDENRELLVVKTEIDSTGTKMEVTATPTKEKALELTSGMSYREVINLLGYPEGPGMTGATSYLWSLENGEDLLVLFAGIPSDDKSLYSKYEIFVSSAQIFPKGYSYGGEYYTVVEYHR